MTSSRPPFTKFEKDFLIELITPHIQIVESKKTNSNFSKDKEKVWVQVAEKFNSNPLCTQTSHKQLKKAWQNMKTRMRDAKTLEQQRKHTGGGPYIPDMTPEDEAVLATIPNILPKVKVVKDSDGIFCDSDSGDDDSMFWLAKRSRKQSPDPTMSPQIKNISSTQPPPPQPKPGPSREHISKPPEQPVQQQPAQQQPAQQQPVQQQPAQHTSSVPPSTYKNQHKKTSVDELKIKIIENDLETREIKNAMEIQHLKRTYEMKEKLLELELKYKEKLLAIAEVELKDKLKK